jgi:hypothetical protein
MIRSMLLVLATVSLCLSQVSTQGLVAWYPFNGNATNMAPGATVQLSYVSTSTQVPTFTKELSRNNDSNAMKLVYLNGLYGSDSPLPKGNSNRTISVWMWWNGGMSYPLNIISYGTTTPGKGFSMVIGSTYALTVSNGTDALTLITQMPGRLWTNVVVVIKGDTTYGYVGGSLMAYKRITTWNTENLLAANALIGGRNGSNQTYMGTIDDIAIYDRALTSGQVLELFRASPFLTSTAPAVAHLSQVSQLAQKPYTVLANGQVVRQQPSGLRRLFNLFK